MAKKNVGKKALDENNLENVAGGRVYKNDNGTWRSEVVGYNKKNGFKAQSYTDIDSERDAQIVDEYSSRVLGSEGFDIIE